jgi:hypothetical protein
MEWTEAFDYLRSRGEPYGITSMELVDKTPSIIHDNPEAIVNFWQHKDISHILPTSTHPELAGDFNNWIPEDPLPNQARGNDTMSLDDRLEAGIDNLLDALQSIAAVLT